MTSSPRKDLKSRRIPAFLLSLLMAIAVLWTGAVPAQAASYVATEFSGPASGPPDEWSMSWTDSNWSTVDVGDDLVALRHEVDPAATVNLRRALTWDAPGTDGVIEGDVEVHAVMRVPGTLTTTTRFALALHVDGVAGAEDAYYLDVNGSNLRLNRYRNGAWSQIDSVYNIGGFEANVWYNLVLRRDANTLQGKIWPHGQAEPAGWQVSSANTATVLSQGRVGVLNAHAGAVTETAYFSVGTGGDSAVRAPADLIPEPPFDPLLTGFENREGAGWTTHQEEQDFLAAVDEASDRTRITQIGSSANGLPINMARIGIPAAPTDEEIAEGRSILVIGAQHGNEPAGQEMALQLVRDLAFTDDAALTEQLSDTSVLVIPTMNPDGRLANRRSLANGLDMNRDHLALTSIEARLMAQVIRDFKPDVIVDAHEKPTTLGGADLDALWPRNLAIDPTLLALSREMVTDYVFADLNGAGMSTAIYGGAGASTTGNENEAIARNMFGLRGSVAVLIETAGLRPGLERLSYQQAAVEAVFRFQRENAERIEQVVTEAPVNRQNDGANQAPFYLRGADNDPPLPQYTLDPAPCAYVLTPEQLEQVEQVFSLYGVQTQTRDAGDVFVTMAQPAMAVVPLLIDAGARSNIVEGTPLYDVAECPLGVVANLTAPSISGTPEVGQTLMADPGTWTPVDTELSYQWLADDEQIDGATGTTFALTAAQEDQSISVQITGTRDRYEAASATSEPVGPVRAADSGGGDDDGGDDDADAADGGDDAGTGDGDDSVGDGDGGDDAGTGDGADDAGTGDGADDAGTGDGGDDAGTGDGGDDAGTGDGGDNGTSDGDDSGSGNIGDDASDDRLSDTGSEVPWYLGGLALALTLSGIVLAIRKRRVLSADSDQA